MLFAGGGTGGHVFPGIAVARRLMATRVVRVAWVGARNGMEQDIITRHGIEYFGIPAGKLRRYLSFRNLVDVFRIVAGLIVSLRLMGRLRPALLFSKGGFVSVTPVIAARLRGVPVVTHESDADPGLATRINARFALRVLVAYPHSIQHFPPAIRDRVAVTGNPLREDLFDGRRERGLEAAGFPEQDARPVALFLGGSQGARQINELVEALLPDVLAAWRVIHQTGEGWAASGHAGVGAVMGGAAERAGYFRAAFFRDELPHILAAADLVVCRAGAGTLWEVAALAKPMLLVPLATGSRGDQLRNARVFESAGAARVFTDASRLHEEISAAMDELAAEPQRGKEMGQNAHGMIHIDATAQIVTILGNMLDVARR